MGCIQCAICGDYGLCISLRFVLRAHPICQQALTIPPGIYLSYGVFQAYYKTAFESSTNSAWIGALSSGLPFLGAPLIVYICTHRTWSRIHFVWVGWLLGVVGMVSAAFSPTISALIGTQGLLFGLSILIADNPLLLIVNTWFRAHRGLAYGVIFGFCDLCGFAWSFLAEYLLQHLGRRKTLLVFAAMLFAIPGPCILLLKERGATNILHRSMLSATPNTASQQYGRRGSSGREVCDDNLVSSIGGSFELIRRDTPPVMKKRYFSRPIFYVFASANLAQSLAFYLPLIYLPTYALHLNPNAIDSAADKGHAPSNSTGALVLALLNLSQIAGELIFGRLSDFWSVHLLSIAACSLGSMSTFLLWGFATSKALLLSYAIIFGLAGAGYSALWARMGTVFGERDAMMVFGVLCAGRGLGGVVSGPISLGLLGSGAASLEGGGDSIDKGRGWAEAVADGQYKNLVVFVGVCMAVATILSCVGFVIDWPEKNETGVKQISEAGIEYFDERRGWVRRVSSTRGRRRSSAIPPEVLGPKASVSEIEEVSEEERQQRPGVHELDFANIENDCAFLDRWCAEQRHGRQRHEAARQNGRGHRSTKSEPISKAMRAEITPRTDR